LTYRVKTGAAHLSAPRAYFWIGIGAAVSYGGVVGVLTSVEGTVAIVKVWENCLVKTTMRVPYDELEAVG
jgi:hypothetical protein